MDCGILRHGESRTLFERVNTSPLCEKCRVVRAEFADRDKKGHPCYSNLLPGFSSRDITIPLDVLIIAEAHGGGRDADFRPQKDLDYEVIRLANYYRSDDLQRFHQQQVRNLLDRLDRVGKTWVFTDLVKCFVDSRSRHNRRIAISHCRNYLDDQIHLFRPRHILALGRTVAREYFKYSRLKHGSACDISVGDQPCALIYSMFPSRNTADLWVKEHGWTPIVSVLREIDKARPTFCQGIQY